MKLSTFEDKLFPKSLRWEYALGNVAYDFIHRGDTIVSQQQFTDQADKFFLGWRESHPNPRIGMMSLLLPIGCNATCPGICYTDITNRRKNSADLTFVEIYHLIQNFASLGGKVLRIIGDGEPFLYRQLPEISDLCKQLDINLIVFTNGLVLPKSIIKDYAKGSVYFYIKLWSENLGTQNRMVQPRKPYVWVNGELGPAPKTFYDLYKTDPDRVGFQVMASSVNLPDALQIVQGRKASQPILAEAFIPKGAGKNRSDMVTVFPGTKACSFPPRSSYLAVINSHGQLQPGTFVRERSISIKSGLRQIWSSIHVRNELFYQARYSRGCFCEAMKLKGK